MGNAKTGLRDVNWAAERLGRSRECTYRLVREGVLPAVRLGRAIAFDPDRIEQFIERGGCGLDEKDSASSEATR